MKSEEKKYNSNKELDITKADRKSGDEPSNSENSVLKKRENQPDFAANNLDVPGGRNARPITNDRHQDDDSKHHNLNRDQDEKLD